jgi:hypothetical protein
VPLLARLAANRSPTELLFGQHWRDWPRHCVQAICRKAKLPVVIAHGHVVAKALGSAAWSRCWT